MPFYFCIQYTEWGVLMIISIIVSCMIAYATFLLFLYDFGQQEDDIDYVDYILVLGAKANGLQLSSTLRRRLQVAYRLSKQVDAKIIVSGGYTSSLSCSEAKAMQVYLLLLGVDKERILLEDKAASTYQNFLYTYKLLGNSGAKVALVTCDFHMYRACKIGGKLGFTCVRKPTSSLSFHNIKEYSRECLCLIKYWIIKN